MNTRPSQILDDLERIVAEERDAIVRLDSAAIEALSSQKEELVTALATAGVPTDTHARLAALVGKLKRNCLLLVHARDLTKSLLGQGPGESRRAVRVSIEG